MGKNSKAMGSEDCFEGSEPGVWIQLSYAQDFKCRDRGCPYGVFYEHAVFMQGSIWQTGSWLQQKNDWDMPVVEFSDMR
jgi:hypothetical protein